MITYFMRTGSNYYGDLGWQEVEVDETQLQHVEDNLYMYKGQLVHQTDPQNDKYFWLRFTGPITWLPNTKAFPK